MKIFNLVIMRFKDYEGVLENHRKDVERIKKNHAAYVGTLVDEKASLESRIKEIDKENIDKTSELRNQISILENKVDKAIKQIDSLINSNRSLKGSNTKLSDENKKLKEKVKTLSKHQILPPDRTKSKQIPKVKSSSRQSSLVKMMNG